MRHGNESGFDKQQLVAPNIHHPRPMALSEKQVDDLLTKARSNIGTPYSQMDCSHFVHKAFDDAGHAYPYRSSATFAQLVGLGYFEEVAKSQGGRYDLLAGDVLVFKGHMGIWDPLGCEVLAQTDNPNPECKSLKNNAPFLSSRSGNMRGPDFGITKWWGGDSGIQGVYRWKK